MNRHYIPELIGDSQQERSVNSVLKLIRTYGQIKLQVHL